MHLPDQAMSATCHSLLRHRVYLQLRFYRFDFALLREQIRLNLLVLCVHSRQFALQISDHLKQSSTMTSLWRRKRICNVLPQRRHRVPPAAA